MKPSGHLHNKHHAGLPLLAITISHEQFCKRGTEALPHMPQDSPPDPQWRLLVRLAQCLRLGEDHGARVTIAQRRHSFSKGCGGFLLEQQDLSLFQASYRNPCWLVPLSDSRGL